MLIPTVSELAVVGIVKAVTVGAVVSDVGVGGIGLLFPPTVPSRDFSKAVRAVACDFISL